MPILIINKFLLKYISKYFFSSQMRKILYSSPLIFSSKKFKNKEEKKKELLLKYDHKSWALLKGFFIFFCITFCFLLPRFFHFFIISYALREDFLPDFVLFELSSSLFLRYPISYNVYPKPFVC